MKKKKTSRRSAKKYSSLIPEMNLKTRQELIDYDYLNKLNEEELEWLNRFTAEYTCADMDREDFSKNVNCTTKKAKQESDKRNNLRKDDIYLNLKVINMLDSWEDYKGAVAEQEDLFEESDDLKDSQDKPGNTDDTDPDESGNF